MRIIEIILFLVPFTAFVLWRLYFRTLVVPVWFIGVLGFFILLILGGLLWTRHEVAGDAKEQYRPAILQDGHVVPGGPVRPPDNPVRPP